MATSLASSTQNFRTTGAGKLYIVAAPTTGIADIDDYLDLFVNPDRKTIKAGVTEWANLTSGGIEVKIKPSTATFDPNIGPKTKLVTGIDEASCSFEFFDVDPAHINDVFGSQSADIITTAAVAAVVEPPTAATVSRKCALVGPQSYNTLYCVCYRMPAKVAGEFSHYIFPQASMVADLTLKANKKDPMSIKMELQLMCSTFVNNSAGFGVVFLSDDPQAV